MSRLGEWFLGVVTPYPRLAAFLHYLKHPGLAWRKVRARLRRLRGRPRYRELVRRDLLVPELAPPGGGPTLSVLMPVYRVAEDHLRAAVGSVVRQTETEWELVLVDDASPDPHVRRVIRELAGADPRIRPVLRDKNRGIAGASDEGLKHVRGDFVAFLDHDDLLHPRALETVRRFLGANPEVDWLFSDEDKVDERGVRFEPCIKPGWSHHLLLSFNYVCHFRVVQRTALERVGGHRQGFDGAQDYDLALRVLAAGGRFAHVRGVLYHWRTVATSMARAAAAKPAAHEHALRALAHHARSWPRGGEVETSVLLAPASFFKVRRWADPELGVAVLAPGGTGPVASPRVRETQPLPEAGGFEGIVEAAARSGAPVVVVPPPGGFTAAELEELLALLQVPGTALAAGRAVRGRQVAGSGWWVREDGVAVDPWFGLDARDPGYLNLAMVPGPRELPPPVGWVAWREDLVAGWEAAEDVADAWRLGVGLARIGRETVSTPTVSWRAAAAICWPPRPPEGVPVRESLWLRDLDLAHCYAAGYAPEGMQG